MDKKVEESTEYDNFMDHMGETIYEAPSLADFVDIDDNKDDWEKHWVGMPTYKQEENKTYKTVVIEFNKKIEKFENIFPLKNTNLKCIDANVYDLIIKKQFNIKIDLLKKKYVSRTKFKSDDYLYL